MPTALSSVLAAATLPEAVVEVCLNGALAAEVEALDTQLREAEQAAAARGELVADDRLLAGPQIDPAVLALARQVQAKQDEMRASTYEFRLRGLSKRSWDALILKHPPRDGDDGDRRLGFDRSTLFPALLRACMVDPVPDSDAEYEQLLDVLNAGQFAKLANAALDLSSADVVVPFSPTASGLNLASSEASGSPAPSASRTADSKAGSRKR